VFVLYCRASQLLLAGRQGCLTGTYYTRGEALCHCLATQPFFFCCVVVNHSFDDDL
jgi:hypothetical protein